MLNSTNVLVCQEVTCKGRLEYGVIRLAPSPSRLTVYKDVVELFEVRRV